MESGEPDFQLAPMIDVLLVMLIFFMTITSAQVLRVDKNIQLPTAPNASSRTCAPILKSSTPAASTSTAPRCASGARARPISKAAPV